MNSTDHADSPRSISSIEELRSMYDAPSELVLKSKTNYLHQFHIDHLAVASFVCIGSASSTGFDVSPRGGEPGFVKALDNKRVAFPDWPGNNKVETMSNLVDDSRLGMLFLFPGLDYFMRLNGEAEISRDPLLCERFSHQGRLPKSVITMTVREAYFHCGKAINRARLWNPSSQIARGVLPSIGTIIAELIKVPALTSETFDKEYERAVKNDLYVAPSDQQR